MLTGQIHKTITLSTSMVADRRRIRKKAPFDLAFLQSEIPGFAHVLANAIVRIDELPDFSEAKSIAIMTDFGGEHPGACFNTYSFLILAFDKIQPFEVAVDAMRRRHSILDPYSEFRFKKLAYGPRARALPEFLKIADTLIHGAIVTIAIDKKINSLFGGAARIEDALSSMGLGKWKARTGEKVMRICHSLAVFVALLAKGDQPIFWYCDNDEINQKTSDRNFASTQEIFLRALGMYSKERAAVTGFGKSFEKKSYLDDLLSLPDLAAGIVQDMLSEHDTGRESPGGEEKILLAKWMAKTSRFLSKITLQVVRGPGDEILSGDVKFSATGK